MPSPFFSVVFVRCHFVSVLVCWLGGSFAKLWFVGRLEQFYKYATKSVGYLQSERFLFRMSVFK